MSCKNMNFKSLLLNYRKNNEILLCWAKVRYLHITKKWENRAQSFQARLTLMNKVNNEIFILQYPLHIPNFFLSPLNFWPFKTPEYIKKISILFLSQIPHYSLARQYYRMFELVQFHTDRRYYGRITRSSDIVVEGKGCRCSEHAHNLTPCPP